MQDIRKMKLTAWYHLKENPLKEGTPIPKDTTIQKATETKEENKDDELKMLRDEIKGLKDIVRAQSLLSAETTASNTVSTDNDKAIASIISPETFRNERK